CINHSSATEMNCVKRRESRHYRALGGRQSSTREKQSGGMDVGRSESRAKSALAPVSLSTAGPNASEVPVEKRTGSPYRVDIYPQERASSAVSGCSTAGLSPLVSGTAGRFPGACFGCPRANRGQCLESK